MRRPQRSTLFPYTTLFRSIGRNTTEGIESVEQPGARLVHRTLFPHGVLHTERTDFFAKQHNDLTRHACLLLCVNCRSADGHDQPDHAPAITEGIFSGMALSRFT